METWVGLPWVRLCSPAAVWRAANELISRSRLSRLNMTGSAGDERVLVFSLWLWRVTVIKMNQVRNEGACVCIWVKDSVASRRQVHMLPLCILTESGAVQQWDSSPEPLDHVTSGCAPRLWAAPSHPLWDRTGRPPNRTVCCLRGPHVVVVAAFNLCKFLTEMGGASALQVVWVCCRRAEVGGHLASISVCQSTVATPPARHELFDVPENKPHCGRCIWCESNHPRSRICFTYSKKKKKRETSSKNMSPKLRSGCCFNTANTEKKKKKISYFILSFCASLEPIFCTVLVRTVRKQWRDCPLRNSPSITSATRLVLKISLLWCL